MKLIIVTVTLIVSFVLSNEKSILAAMYHVQTSGSDSNSCSAAQSASTPKRTIKAALNCIGTADGAGAGHTVRVYAGTYAESIDNNVPGGTSWSAPFTLESNPGDVVTIRPSGCVISVAIRRSTSKYIIIKGGIGTRLVVDASGCTNDGIKITHGTSTGASHHIRLQDVEITNATNQGIQITSQSCCNELIRVYSHHNGTTVDLDHGLYIKSSDNLVEHSIFERNLSRGIQIRADSLTAHRNTIRNNIIRDNGVGGASSGVVITSGNDNLFYNNIVSGSATNGVSITCTGGCPSQTKIYNNTIYNNGDRAVSFTSSGSPSSTEVKNNIFWQNRMNGVSKGRSTGTVQSNNLSSDPQFVDPSNFNFRLSSGSPAIDTGVTIGLVSTDFAGTERPQGSNYDIGAFEYTGSTGSTLAAPSNLQAIVQ